TAQHSTNKGQEFETVQMLRDVIVVHEYKANHLVDRLPARGEQENGRSQACLPDVAAEIEAIAQRQHDIQDDQVKRQTCRLVESLLAVAGKVDHVALAAEAVRQGHAQRFFVFYQQNIFIHDFCN